SQVVTANMTVGNTQANGVVSMPASQPADWRQSWGKADNHKSQSDLPAAQAGRPDPLKTPDRFALSALDKTGTGMSRSTMQPVVSTSMPKQPGVEFVAGTASTIPYGAQSVLGAGTDANGQVVYVPVPVVTVPYGMRPQPPLAQVPRPPQPVRPPQGP